MEKLKVLILEDDRNDVELIQKEILSSMKYEIVFKWIVSKRDFINALGEFQPDIILSDYNLPQLTGFQALEMAIEKSPLIPFIIVTGTLSEETAANSILQGAWDYVVKERLHRLPRAIENALKLKKERQKVFIAQEEIKLLKKQTGIHIRLLYDAINHAPSSMVIVDNVGTILFVNSRFTEVTGIDSKEVLGKNVKIFNRESNNENIFKIIWTTIHEGKEWKGELINKKKNGEPYWAWVNISPILDEKNKITHFIIIEHDITELKEKEHSLQSSESKLRLITDNISDLIAVLDLDGKRIYNSPSYSDLLGDPDSLVGSDSFEEIHPEDKERVKRVFKETVEEGKGKGIEYRMIDKEGNVRYIESRGNMIYDDKGQKSQVVIVSRDITERKLIESILEAERILLRTVIDNLPDAIYVKDNDLRKILVNKADLENIGKIEADVIGRTDYDFFPPEIAAQTYKDDEYVVKEGKPIINKEEFLINVHGKKQWLLTSKLPLYNKEGNITGIVGIGHDITENKKMVEELIAAKEKAEEMNRLKSIFLANMSHELRTPLVGLLGFSEVLANDLTGEMQEYAEMISASGERLLRTLSTILDYSKIETEKLELFNKNISLIDLLNNEIKLFTPMAKTNGITINSEFEFNQVNIITDERLLIEIIDNLISNAVKFTEKGSIRIQLQKHNEEVVIKVIDTGIGIPREKFELIFEEFRQVSEGNSRSFQGTGLGLTVVKKYLNLINGRIEVESEVGVGSTFTVYLPMTPQLEESAGVLTAPNPAMPNKNKNRTKPNEIKILLVEDDLINEMAFKKMLDKHYLVDSVNNAIDAIKAASDYEYGAILMDINLGKGLNGLEAAKEIRKNNNYREKPIIAITAYAMNNEKEEFLRSGCTHYLAKPFKQQVLLDMLNSIFEIK